MVNEKGNRHDWMNIKVDGIYVTYVYVLRLFILSNNSKEKKSTNITMVKCWLYSY